jgi:FkbM family methyltransferase
VSFAFYLRGWNGITVEPNPWLAQLTEAVRPRDSRNQSLVGGKPGETTYYLVEDFHGLSTTVEGHALKAQSEFGKSAQAMTMPVTTLRALCEQHAPAAIDFLKIDVEGAEREVLLGGDWRRFRPKVIVLEALAPVTMAPAWEAWEPLLTAQDYRFAYFDSLNRYYVAEEHTALAERLTAAPPSFAGVIPFGQFKPALDDASHPDHGLARLLAGADMVRLPLMSLDSIAERLINGLDPADPDRAGAAFRYRRCPPAAVRHSRAAALGESSPTRPQLDDPRPLSQCGRNRSVSGSLRAHLGKLGLVTVPSHQAFRSALACSLHSPFAIALGPMRP